MLRIAIMGVLIMGRVFAQQPTPPIQRAIQDLVSRHALPDQAARANVPLPTPPKSPCSVPLLAAKIPENVTFTIEKMRPSHAVARMPQAIVPAPPCGTAN